jgi:hypothetical protein
MGAPDHRPPDARMYLRRVMAGSRPDMTERAGVLADVLPDCCKDLIADVRHVLF